MPRNPAAVLPLGGIVVGGAMTATTLAGRRLLAEYGGRYGEFEAGLSIGLMPAAAFKLVAGPVAGDALLPVLDQTGTVGLVTLPGTFVGMVLGGASPQAAAGLQLVVLLGLLAAEAMAIVVVTELLARAPLPDGTYGHAINEDPSSSSRTRSRRTMGHSRWASSSAQTSPTPHASVVCVTSGVSATAPVGSSCSHDRPPAPESVRRSAS